MCFSAAASFAGSAVMSSVGVANVKRPLKPSQRIFASIPLIFGAQQLLEGIIWVTLRSGRYSQLQDFSAHFYLIAALVVWPTLIPLSTFFMEEVGSRKKTIAVFLGIGVIVSVYSAYSLTFYQVTPQIQGAHIVYITNFPNIAGDVSFVMYLASTTFSLFVSSVKHMGQLGIMIIASLIVTSVFFAHYLTSVWCFFAAAISVMVYCILSEQPETGIVTDNSVTVPVRK